MPLTCTAPRLTAAERRTNLAEEILASEMPQILGFVMRCYERMIRERRGYTAVPSAAAAISVWRGDSDSVQAWLEDACEADGASAFRGLYEHYERYAARNGSRPVGSRLFGTRLDSLGFKSVLSPDRCVRMRQITIKAGG